MGAMFLPFKTETCNENRTSVSLVESSILTCCQPLQKITKIAIMAVALKIETCNKIQTQVSLGQSSLEHDVSHLTWQSLKCH